MQVRERTKKETPQSTTDGVLVHRALSGDQSAFEDLIRRYQVPLFNFIYHSLRDYDLACDVAQHVFLQLYLSLPTLRTDAPLKSWLFQVARNRCLDEVRRKHALHFSDLESTKDDEDDLSPIAMLPDSDPLPDEIAEQHELQQALQQAIDTLPPKYRSVVLLRYTGRLTFAEIAETLSMPEATAKTYFQRARPHLRSALTQWWETQKGALV
jgi:RNA polymerase sigma factor (sigma-70 family)